MVYEQIFSLIMMIIMGVDEIIALMLLILLLDSKEYKKAFLCSLALIGLAIIGTGFTREYLETGGTIPPPISLVIVISCGMVVGILWILGEKGGKFP